MKEQKFDMSSTCLQDNYQTMGIKCRDGKITEEEFQDWFSTHCAKCKYMSEVCMYGEV